MRNESLSELDNDTQLDSNSMHEINNMTEEESNRTIISSDNGKNEVIDIVNLINHSGNSAIAIRIGTLFESGISEQNLINAYMDLSANVKDEQTALRNLRLACDKLLRTVSENNNGIIIDETTGKKDPIRSLQSQVEAGIVSPDCAIIMPLEQKSIELVYGKDFSKSQNLGQDIMDLEILSTKEKKFIINEYIKDNAQIDDFFDKLNFNYESYDDIKKNPEMENLMITCGITEEEIKKERKEAKWIFIDNVYDKNFVKIMFLLKSGKGNKEELLNELTKNPNYKLSKYYDEYIGNIGKENVDERISSFCEKFEKIENKTTLQQYLKNYIKITHHISPEFYAEKLNDFNKKDIIITLARGMNSDDTVTQKYLKTLCNNLGIKYDSKNTDQNKEKILKFAKKYYGEPLASKNSLEDVEKTLGEIIERNEFNEKTANRKLKEISKSFKLTKEEKVIYSVLDSLNTSTLVENRANGENARVIALLYDNYKPENAKGKNIQRQKEKEEQYEKIQNIIGEYMEKHKETFGEFLSTNKSGEIYLDTKKISDYVNENENSMGPMASRNKAHVFTMSAQIGWRIDSIDNKKKIFNYDRKKERLEDKVKQIKANNEKLSDNEFEKLLKKAEKLEIDESFLKNITKDDLINKKTYDKVIKDNQAKNSNKREHASKILKIIKIPSHAVVSLGVYLYDIGRKSSTLSKLNPFKKKRNVKELGPGDDTPTVILATSSDDKTNAMSDFDKGLRVNIAPAVTHKEDGKESDMKLEDVHVDGETKKEGKRHPSTDEEGIEY